jgi:hypothetical protein
MSIATIISGITGATGLKDLVLGILDRIKLSPEKKAEVELAMATNAQELQKIQMEMEAKEQESIAREIEAASANIRAEVTNGDKFTSRSRPSFVYMMLLIMACNYVIFPLVGRSVIEYPEALYWLFGSVMLGYTGARTWEKIGLPKK